jgi:hypothetical protein
LERSRWHRRPMIALHELVRIFPTVAQEVADPTSEGSGSGYNRSATVRIRWTHPRELTN